MSYLNRFSIYVISFSIQLMGIAQGSIDLSGDWNGTATFLDSRIRISLELQQDQDKISGFLISKDENNRDSSKKKISGTIRGNQVELKEIEYVYRNDKTCLATSQLILEQNGEIEVLTGKWSGDWKLTTCAPGVSGPIVIYRENGAEKSAEIPVIVSKQTSEPDDLRLAMIKELRTKKYHALLIGINDYNDARITSLEQPLSDANQLAEILISRYSFEAENVTVLENPGRAEVINALDQLAGFVNEHENLLIFYAGHGIWNSQLEQGYWLPADANQNSKANWLSNSTIRDYLRGIPAKHTLLISDACFSGGILKERAIQESSRAMLEMYRLPSRKAMTSGTMTTVPDKSVFMKYLLKSLGENESAMISADQLFRNFRIAVIHNSPVNQLPQYGPIREAGDEGGDFIFLRR